MGPSTQITVRLAQRLLDSKEYTPLKWPMEFTDEFFFPLLERHRYNQGSLSQAGLQTVWVSNPIPLPPLHEAVWQPD